jgi:iron-sulfur cluster repair protein YtfE (RIC family)
VQRSRATRSTTGRRQHPRGSRPDPVKEFQHDHGALNKRVLDLAALVREVERDRAGPELRGRLAEALHDLRDHLFLHFAREEEGLFPFVEAAFPDLGKMVTSMVAAHDGLCGTLARMTHEVSANKDGATGPVAAIFSRFETAYADHAQRERKLLDKIGPRLRPKQREALAELVRGL